MSDDRPNRRQHERRDDRAEMLFGSGRTYVSNLSPSGAFVAILSGLHEGDSFSFELELDGEEGRPVRGRAHVRWTDPGIGAGVQFEFSPEEKERLAGYLQKLRGLPGVETPQPDHEYDVPRKSRRTVALGPESPGGETKVWFRYLPPDESS